MHSALLLAALASSSLVAAAPFGSHSKTFSNAASAADLAVLKFADVLERVETQFFTQLLQSFNDSDYTDAGFVSGQVPSEQIQRIRNDELTHQTFLNATILSLGSTPIPDCIFSFGDALSSVDVALATSRVIEITGTGAYTGSLHLLTDLSILTTSATIATIEARHQAILNALNDGTALSQSFDVALLPEEVLSLAGGFISNCDPGFDAFPPLAVTNSAPLVPSAALNLSSPALANFTNTTLFCQTLTPGETLSTSLPLSSCAVPANATTGPLFLWVTDSEQPLSGDVVTRGKHRNFTSIVAGPDIVFIDPVPGEALGSIIRGGNVTA